MLQIRRRLVVEIPAGMDARSALALLQLGYGAGVQELGGGDGDLNTDRGPADEHLVRTDIGRVEHPMWEALVVTVAGEIDLYTADRFRAALRAGLDQLRDGEILVIDLTKVTFMSSTGLQALVDVALAMQPRREPLRLVVDHTRSVIRPLEITGLDEYLALFTTVEDALRAPC